MTSRLKIQITDIDTKGRGIGRDDSGKVYFVADALPGETIIAAPVEGTRSDAKLIERLTSADSRVAPACPLYPECGGCDLLHMSYEAQLAWKHQRVKNSMERIAGIAPEVLDRTAVSTSAHPSPESRHYRNNVQYHIERQPDGGLKIGFRARGAHRVIDQPPSTCLISAPVADAVAQSLRAFFNKQEEAPSTLTVRHSQTTGAVLVMVEGAIEPNVLDVWRPILETGLPKPYYLEGLLHRSAGPRSRRRVPESRPYSVIFGSSTYQEVHAAEPSYLEKQMHIIHAEGFAQVNPPQLLYAQSQMQAWTKGLGIRNVIDLYGGTGVLGLPFAQHGADVHVVERTTVAAPTGKQQAEANNVAQLMHFHTLDAVAFLKKQPSSFNTTDLIITDPPRQGLDPILVDAIITSPTPYWIYMSCDPATLARDLKRVFEHKGAPKYTLASWVTLDMFPHTGHVETVVLMSRVDK